MEPTIDFLIEQREWLVKIAGLFILAGAISCTFFTSRFDYANERIPRISFVFGATVITFIAIGVFSSEEKVEAIAGFLISIISLGFSIFFARGYVKIDKEYRLRKIREMIPSLSNPPVNSKTEEQIRKINNLSPKKLRKKLGANISIPQVTE